MKKLFLAILTVFNFCMFVPGSTVLAGEKNRPRQKVAVSITNFIPDGWMVVEDVKPKKFQVRDLEFVSFLKEDESHISGEEMRRRSIQLKANFGLADGEYILKHQAEIPVWIQNKCIILSSTVLRDPDGFLYTADLYWDGDRWVLEWQWLGHSLINSCVLPQGKQ